LVARERLEKRQRFKTKIGNLLVPGNNDPWPEVRDTLNISAWLVELLLPRDAPIGIPRR
jgi:hypothetical protein